MAADVNGLQLEKIDHLFSSSSCVTEVFDKQFKTKTSEMESSERQSTLLSLVFI